MNRRCKLLALVIIAAAAACSLPAKWEKLSEGGFTVEMPGKAEKQTQTVPTAAGSVAINMFTVEKGGEAFIVGYNDFPAAAAEAVNLDQMLNNARDGAIRNVNGKLTSERAVTLNGAPGKEFVGEATTPQAGTFTARIYWAKPRLYQVLYVRPKSAAASTNGEKFLASFQLTGK